MTKSEVRESGKTEKINIYRTKNFRGIILRDLLGGGGSGRFLGGYFPLDNHTDGNSPEFSVPGNNLLGTIYQGQFYEGLFSGGDSTGATFSGSNSTVSVLILVN